MQNPKSQTPAFRDSVEEMRTLWRQLPPEHQRVVYDLACRLLAAQEAKAKAKAKAKEEAA